MVPDGALVQGIEMNKLLLSIALLAVGGIHAATADGPVSAADDLIAARQAGMLIQSSLLADIMRAIGANAEIGSFEDAGEAIAAWSMALPGLFPVGTEHGHSTRALPAIWSDRAGFEQAATNLTQAAQLMAKAAAAGKQSEFIKAFRATSLACAGCHFTYRYGLN
jgi:cytochrome c556